MKAALLLPLVLLVACGRYADFTLPKLDSRPGALTWEWTVRPEPVIARGTKGQWDGIDVLNPSVVRTGALLTNLYSGYDGRVWHTGFAVSRDGINWTRHSRLLSPDSKTWEGDYIAANGSVVLFGRDLLYWYQAGRVPRIGLARSADGFRYTREPEPVLDVGPRGSWDERGVADPYVIRIGDTFYMYYLGQDRARRQRLGLARSRDGVKWEKLRSNPILEIGEYGAFDETGLGEPAVWQQHGSYWMLYTARDRREYRRLGLARSQDGVNWLRVTTKPVLEGQYPWMSKVVCDPTVEVAGETVRVWFGGGDQPQPAENLNGQIGYAELRLRIKNAQ